MPDAVETLIAALIAARARRRRAAPPASLRDAAEAYRVQAGVVAGAAIAGFKTARKPDGPQIMAPILAADVRASGARVASAFGGPLGVELEVGLRIDAPLPPADAPDFAERAVACVRPVAVIEIVDTRLAGDRAAAPLLKLADNQINAGLVVGPEMADWRGRPLARVAARMIAGETCLLDGPAEVPGGCPLETLAGLAAMIGDHCGGLRVGHVDITGAMHPLTYVAPPALVEGWIDGFGPVRVALA